MDTIGVVTEQVSSDRLENDFAVMDAIRHRRYPPVLPCNGLGIKRAPNSTIPQIAKTETYFFW